MPPEDWQKCRREAKKAGQTVFQYLDIPDPGASKSSAGVAAVALAVGEITDDEDDATEKEDRPERSSVGLASPTLKGGDPVGLDSLDIDCERNLPLRKCREFPGDNNPVDRSYTWCASSLRPRTVDTILKIEAIAAGIESPITFPTPTKNQSSACTKVRFLRLPFCSHDHTIRSEE